MTAVSALFPRSVASMKNVEHAPYSPSDPTTHKLKSQSKTWNASIGKTRVSCINSSRTFSSVYSQHPRLPTTNHLPISSVRPAKVPKSNFGFFLAQISADILSQEVIRIHEQCLRSLLILVPPTSPHHLQQCTAGAQRSTWQQRPRPTRG